MKRIVLAAAVIIAWSSGAAAQAPAATGQPGARELTPTAVKDRPGRARAIVRAVLREELMFALEQDYAARHRDLAATIYTSMGTLETTLMRSTWQDFFQTLQGRPYKSLRVIVANMNDAKHATAIGMSLYPGLKAVLGGMPLDTTTIDRYIGRFKFQQGDTLSITREGQTLLAAWNGEEGLKLAARTPTTFSFTTGQVQLVAGTPKLLPLIGLEYLDVTITAQGTVDRVVLHREGHSFTGTRESPER